MFRLYFILCVFMTGTLLVVDAHVQVIMYARYIYDMTPVSFGCTPCSGYILYYVYL